MENVIKTVGLFAVTLLIMTSIVAVATSNMPSKEVKADVSRVILNGIY